MRVLFVTYAERTHFLAMAPLAWALRTAGHEVRFASQPAFVDEITQAGLTAVPVGRYRDPARALELTPGWQTAGRAGLPRPYDVAQRHPDDVSWPYLRDEFARQVKDWHKYENVPMIPDLVAFARAWRPDLVIWEPTTYAGPIAAKACGARHGRVMFSLDIYGVTRDHYRRLRAQQPPHDRGDALAEWLDAYARHHGGEFTEDMITGEFTIDQFPRSLRMEADLTYLPMRYVPYGGPAVVPQWLRAAPRRPRVAITMGLVATERFDGYAVNLQDILDSLADLEIEVVATVAEAEQRRLARIPDNARLVPFVPLHALVPTCAAVIHHGGFGTLSTTALHAVPQLVLPLHFDEPALAEGLARQGCAIHLPAERATGPAVREALLRLLGEPAFADGAHRMREQMRALPTPNEMARRLAAMTADRRPVTTG
ncbi:activator-dependent family glycosyltransferase [Micromonospora sp. WMMD975]|uniref:activator-dependent family glycosyltransferase n=1 Tax=Micromonospora sp. WMMD975 TaxID=3016087 RepID=UPI00249A1530|nr:activator-dependent family glycosyltransferase [Micromonospora sp. WMMD975]WFE36476.1 activator-dependent family glycosyltransferase [Micromonospora sp. WMMD975]